MNEFADFILIIDVKSCDRSESTTQPFSSDQNRIKNKSNNKNKSFIYFIVGSIFVCFVRILVVNFIRK